MTLRVCAKHGCPTLTASGYCDEHRPVQVDHRASASARGYGPKWTAYATAFRLKHPLCCQCAAAGRKVPTDIVDHIQPVTGPMDPKFWVKTNHQPLCRPCHARKTAAEGRTSQTDPEPKTVPQFIIA